MRDQDPNGPGAPPPSDDGQEGTPASVTRGRFGEPRPERGGGANGHDYSHHSGADGRPVGNRLDEADDEGPVDLVELQADDELINALSSGLGVSVPGNRGYDVDDRLVAMLSSWKGEVDRDPVPELVGTDEAVQMLQPAKPSRKISFLRPLVAAAAVAACALAVVSIGAHEAQPGDALWGVSKVLYSERADQVQAATDLRTGIEQVNAKLAAGDIAGAQRELATLGPLVDRTDPDMRDEFAQQNRFLSAKIAETPPGTPTDPRAPLQDGTPAPPPPTSTEGTPDRSPSPQPGSSTPGSTTGGSTGPEGTSPGGTPSPGGTSSPGETSPGGTSPSPGSTSPGSQDPRVLGGPGGTTDPSESTSPSGSTTTAPRPPETSPTTEGSADPTTTTSTTPTASGEGTGDPAEPTSSTSTGAVSSTPN